MQTQLQELLATKKLPSWLVRDKVFKSFDKVNKIFPGIGLSNFVEPCKLSDYDGVKNIAKALISNARVYLNSSLIVLAAARVPAKKQAKVIQLRSVLSNLVNACLVPATGAINDDLIKIVNDRVSLNLYCDIIDDQNKVYFRKNEGFFRVYNKLSAELAALRCKATLPKIEKNPYFKLFSSDNLPGDRFSIVFSSVGSDGLWDIATMSMRGISSCQRWNGAHKKCLIGSMIDPYVGILYLTAGTKFNELGSKMIRRCIVRFAVDDKTKKPFLLIDRMYPALSEEVLNKFISVVKTKTDNKYDVLYGPMLPGDMYRSSYIPESSATKKLVGNTASYKDTKIRTGKAPTIPSLERHQFNTDLMNMINQASSRAIETIKSNMKIVNDNVDDVPSKLLIDRIVNSPDFVTVDLRKYTNAIYNHLAASNELDKKKLYFNFLVNKKEILKKPTKTLFNDINKYYSNKPHKTKQNKEMSLTGKANKKNFGFVMDYITNNISKDMKTSLLEMVSSNKEVINLPE